MATAASTARRTANSDSTMKAELTRTRAELDVARQRITELAEALTALGFPPEQLTLQLDQIAATNANAAADAVTGRNFHVAVMKAVTDAQNKPDASSTDTLRMLLTKLQKLDQAATAQTRRNHARNRDNVTARRNRIRAMLVGTDTTSP